MYQTSSSGTQTRTCTYGCLPTSQSCTASQCVNDTCTSWSACGGCTPATGSCTCTGTQTCTASTYGCLVNTTKSCTYTSPDNADCDIGKICCGGTCVSMTCTPQVGSQTQFGYNASCDWVQGGSYAYASSSFTPPSDTTHCILSGTSCTIYTGGWTNCTVTYYKNYQISGSYVTCGGVKFYNSYSSSGGNKAYYANCSPMTGCGLTSPCGTQ